MSELGGIGGNEPNTNAAIGAGQIGVGGAQPPSRALSPVEQGEAERTGSPPPDRALSPVEQGEALSGRSVRSVEGVAFDVGADPNAPAVSGWGSQPPGSGYREAWDRTATTLGTTDPAAITSAIETQLYGEATTAPIELDPITVTADPPPSQEGIGSFLDGAIRGEFGDNRSWSATAGQIAVGFIPGVGQIADARDTIAALGQVIRGEEGGWTSLAAAGVGWIPGVGDALKGVIRGGDRVAGEVAQQAVRQGDEAAQAVTRGALRNADGTLNLDNAAARYAEVVNGNRPWSWRGDFDAPMTNAERRQIRDAAVERGLIPDVQYKPGTRYADFNAAGVVQRTETLPRELWHASDRAQFDWLDARIPGGRPEGTTWHHSEIDGRMELVPFGVHNITPHNGGRSPGHWADAPR